MSDYVEMKIRLSKDDTKFIDSLKGKQKYGTSRNSVMNQLVKEAKMQQREFVAELGKEVAKHIDLTRIRIATNSIDKNTQVQLEMLNQLFNTLYTYEPSSDQFIRLSELQFISSRESMSPILKLSRERINEKLHEMRQRKKAGEVVE